MQVEGLLRSVPIRASVAWWLAGEGARSRRVNIVVTERLVACTRPGNLRRRMHHATVIQISGDSHCLRDRRKE